MKIKILFMGTPAFAVPVLQTLIDLGFPIVGVVCQPDKPQGRKQTLTAPPVKELAQRYNIPVLQPASLRGPEIEQEIRQLAPDMIVTAAYGKILPQNLLDLPSLGCLNVHASLLPKYRGAAPVQWSLINGEQETGITIMMMDAGMDTGDILTQQPVHIPENIDSEAMLDKLSELGARMLPQAIKDYTSGDIVPYAQNEDDSITIGMLKRDMGEVDWSRSAREIHNMVRGLYPWPGAYTFCGGKKLKLHRTQVCYDRDLIEASRSLEPGTICSCGGLVRVATGDGVLELLEVQNESGKRMHCRDCAHNYRLGQVMGGDE